MPSIQDLPVEFLTDHLLPILPIRDLLSLSSVDRSFAAVCSDNTFWKRKLKAEYNFDGTGSARTSGWKFIYQGLRDPQVYVWGDKGNGRLGLPHVKTVMGGIPAPARLKIPDALVVDIAAGGWSFHALDSHGRLHVWGQLQAGWATEKDGLSDPMKEVPTPVRLEMPSDVYITNFKCSRNYGLALDSRNRVWLFMSWGRPYWFNSPKLAEPQNPIVQIECGWDFCSALLQSGDILVWWPEQGDLREKLDARMGELDNLKDDANKAIAVKGVAKCFTWVMKGVDPLLLPRIPADLPALKPDGKSGSECKVVRIAAGDRFVVALTDGGHVLALDLPNQALNNLTRASWLYLDKFCDVKAIKETGVFDEAGLVCPSHIEITHVSAHFHTFVTYSTGAGANVLMATTDTVSLDTNPRIIPTLQGIPVVSVHLGDYHFGALTGDGKLLTWGKFQRGAIGLGNPQKIPPGQPGGYDTEEAKELYFGKMAPPEVHVPTEVRFGKEGSKKFAVVAAAAGWHFGALVIDLEPGQEDDPLPIESEEEEKPARGLHIGRAEEDGGRVDHIAHLVGRGRIPFRIGHAGARGIRGRGFTLPVQPPAER